MSDNGISQRIIAKKFNIRISTVSKIINLKHWKNI